MMKIRWNTLWKVPVYCLISSWISFYLTVYLGGFFFTVVTEGADGIKHLSIDPVRSALFNGGLFLAVLLIGGLWAFRSMTKLEIAVAAGITSVVFWLIVLAQLWVPDLVRPAAVTLSYFQNWTGTLAALLMKLTDNLSLSTQLAAFAPLLFIPFGQKKPQ